MSKFTASNGLEVWIDSRGEVRTNYALLFGKRRLSDATTALREFFQHERDEELGRWRWPEHPEFVVYPERDSVRVLRESAGTNWYPIPRSINPVSTDAAIQYQAASAYFEAHPEPKPWHDAKPGEVWILGIGGGYHCDSASVVQTDVGVRFVWGVKDGEIRNIAINDRTIDYARRIWPEEAA